MEFTEGHRGVSTGTDDHKAAKHGVLRLRSSQAQKKKSKKISPRGIVEQIREGEKKKLFEKTKNLVASSGIYFRGDLEITNAT